MKKIVFILTLIAAAYSSFAQFPPNPPPTPPTLPKIENRGSPGVVNNDARQQSQFNQYIPRYADTAEANIPNNLGIDSCGAIIFTYDIMNFWGRACSPKRWVRIGNDQVLPDGVYSGGDVVWTGVGFDYIMTAAVYVLNHVLYTSPQSHVILNPSDLIFTRKDLIGLTPTGANKITGTPSANPQEPAYDPNVFIRRSEVDVNANAVVPDVIQNIIYDEGGQFPDEWNYSTTGAVDWLNLNNPYHLTHDATGTVFVAGQHYDFNFPDTVNTSPRGGLIFFKRLGGALSAAQDFTVVLMYQGVPVSAILTFSSGGLNKSLLNEYQAIAFPMPRFGANNIIFDQIRVTAVGAGTFAAWKDDYIQFQTGVIPIFPNQRFGHPQGDNVLAENRAVNQMGFKVALINGNFGLRDANPTKTFSVGDNNTNTETFTIEAPDASSVYLGAASGASMDINAGINIRVRPTLNTGFMVYDGVPIGAASGVRTRYFTANNSELGRIGLSELVTNVSSQLFFTPISTGGKPTYLNFYAPIIYSNLTQDNTKTRILAMGADSILFWRDVSSIASSTTFYNLNVGAGQRLAIPGTNNIKTQFGINGILGDSTINANAVTWQVDSSAYPTIKKLYNTIDSLGAVIPPTTTYFNHNIGSGDSLAVSNSNNIKSVYGINGVIIDHNTNINALTWQADTATLSTKLFTYHIVDSLVALIASANTNSNVGAGVGLAIAATRNIRSIVAGANITIDASNPNQITIASSAGSPGTLLSFGFTNANGVTGIVTNSTTTPNLTLGTSVAANQVVYSTGTAFAGSTSFIWNPSSSRLRIGATSAATATLNLNPSTTAQASLNIGNGGVAPTAPVNGDIWLATNHILARLGGLTFQLDQQNPIITINSTTIASGTPGRLLFQSAANLVSQSANLFWDNINNRLRLNGATGNAAFNLPAGTIAQAPINFITTGVAPTAPNNGDAWVAANHLNIRLNGVTFQLDQQTLALTVNSSPITSGTSGRIFFQNAANQLSQTANLFYNVGSSALQINNAVTTAALNLPLSTTGQASLNFGYNGVAPSAPNNGDAWIVGNNLFVRLNGVSVQISNPPGGGVTSIAGTANQVIASAATGNVILSLPQSIAITSQVQFQRLTVGGSNALPSFIMNASTDPVAAAGVIANNGTRLAISFAATYKRFAVSNDVAPGAGQTLIGDGLGNYTVAAMAAGNNNLVTSLGNGTWSIRPNSTFTTLTDGASVIWDANTGYNKIWNVGGVGRTLSISNSVNGTTYNVKLINTTGTATVTTWPSGTIWPSGTPPSLPAVAGAIMYVSLTFDGTNFGGAFNPNRFQ